MTYDHILVEEIGRSVIRPETLPEPVRRAVERHHADLRSLVQSLAQAGRTPETIRPLVAQLLRRYETDLLVALEGEDA